MNTNLELTLCQKKQAALLHYFSSTRYIQELDALVNDLMNFVDATLAKSVTERRDQVLADPQWGTRNTSENWGDNAWPFLLDYKKSLLDDIARRASEVYSFTGTNQFIRGTSEYSLMWMTPAEEKEFDRRMYYISHRGTFADYTLTKHDKASRWDDFGLALSWEEFKLQFPRLPRFRIVPTIEGVSGEIPPRTGVYIPQDDVHGSLQFAWCGHAEDRRDGPLIECPTFNEIGLHALKVIGRRDLWYNERKMLAFAMLPEYASVFRKHLYDTRNVLVPELAPSAVARYAFTSRPCKWHYVELIEGEFEDYDDNTIPGVIDDRLRVEAGNQCPRAGYYFTPASPTSRRYFEHGEIMPTIKSELWMTIWQSEE